MIERGLRIAKRREVGSKGIPGGKRAATRVGGIPLAGASGYDGRGASDGKPLEAMRDAGSRGGHPRRRPRRVSPRSRRRSDRGHRPSPADQDFIPRDRHRRDRRGQARDGIEFRHPARLIGRWSGSPASGSRTPPSPTSSPSWRRIPRSRSRIGSRSCWTISTMRWLRGQPLPLRVYLSAYPEIAERGELIRALVDGERHERRRSAGRLNETIADPDPALLLSETPTEAVEVGRRPGAGRRERMRPGPPMSPHRADPDAGRRPADARRCPRRGDPTGDGSDLSVRPGRGAPPPLGGREPPGDAQRRAVHARPPPGHRRDGGRLRGVRPGARGAGRAQDHAAGRPDGPGPVQARVPLARAISPIPTWSTSTSSSRSTTAGSSPWSWSRGATSSATCGAGPQPSRVPRRARRERDAADRGERRRAAVPGPASTASGRLRFDEARLRDALRQLAEGIDALHQSGKLHRDIKPPNVLVTARGAGRPARLRADGRPGELGPAPDDWTGRSSGRSATCRRSRRPGCRSRAASDWYSVGVMLYEAMTGRLPFAGLAAGADHRQADAGRPRRRIARRRAAGGPGAALRRAARPRPGAAGRRAARSSPG